MQMEDTTSSNGGREEQSTVSNINVMASPGPNTANSPRPELHPKFAAVESGRSSRQQFDKTALSNSDATPLSTSRHAKLLATIETLKSKTTSTETQLSTKLHMITQLSSFPISFPAPELRTDQEINQDQEKAALKHAHAIINKHISMLKQYNEIKDIAMGMLSLIAEKEGKRLVEVMEERGINEKD